VTTRIPGRHRAAVRPKSPLTAMCDAVSANAGAASRRSAVLAASSGLVLTLGLPAASAAPLTDTLLTDAGTPAASGALAAGPAPQAQPRVSVPADAKVSFAGTVVGSATAPPVTEVTQERATRASRSTGRASVTSDAGTQHVAEAAAPAAGGSIVGIAERYIGTMYRYGGTTPAGFDCSGFTQYVYGQAGISLPRTSSAQGTGGRQVSAAEARPGDLVWAPGHIGIYAGGNQMIDSPRTGKAVAVREIWFSPTFIRYA
jgi:cell wall-associated NlpC family hydrolase